MATHPEHSSHTSPNKRLKTLDAAPPQSSPSFVPGGKSKIEEEVENESADCCGICLSEAGNGGIIRGYIDSCDHYFCFVCIMEWAKVESKCPFCKRRFSTIRRPRKPPIFISERLVQVPVRDQAYHYSGNAANGPSDPYSEVNCSVCHNTSHENLLLLCDLCDAASHTYCVGLGSTIPEGDWFCHDCKLLRDYSTVETDTDSSIQISTDTLNEPSSANEPVSACDIVRGCGASISQRFKKNASSYPCHLPSTSTTRNLDRPISASLKIVTKIATQPNARTLQHCRDLHDRIRLLRENWNGFRNGNLHFSSPCEGKISSKNSEVECSSSGITKDIGARDIHKAWKMMDKAKSTRQGRQRSTTTSVRKLGDIKNAEDLSCRHLLPDSSQQNGSKNVGSNVQGNHCNHSTEKDYYKQAYSVSGKQKWISHSSEKLPGEKSVKGLDLMSSSVVSEPVVSNVDRVKGVEHISSRSKVNNTKEKSELKKICVDRKEYDDAKSEIQSLVKLNLKFQTKEEKLGVDAFKEVARQATHSILAACGLEQPKPGSCSIQGFLCSHPNENGQLHKSSLMPNSCRECFYVFVKDMVNTVVMFHKTRSREKT
ncbi:hypothetical protein ABFS83_04G138500 [Erythranthe nasuta]